MAERESGTWTQMRVGRESPPLAKAKSESQTEMGWVRRRGSGSQMETDCLRERESGSWSEPSCSRGRESETQSPETEKFLSDASFWEG